MTETQNKLKNLGLSHTISLSNILGPMTVQNGLRAFMVGGLIRDALLNRPSKDIDICVAGDADKMAQVGDWVYSQLSDKMKNRYEIIIRQSGLNTNFRDFLQNCGGGILLSFIVYLTGKADIAPVIYPRFLVGATKINGEDIEFTATRAEDYSTTEGEGSRKRNPGDIQIATEYEDAIRRDFTVNALYVNIATGELLDPTGKGIEDIKNKTIRVTRDENPEIVFLEDPLRILRAIRQSNQLGFKVEPRTEEIIKKLVKEKGKDFFGDGKRSGSVSEERIRDEISNILLSNNPVNGMNGLLDFGVLDVVMPELSDLAYDKEARHKNLWKHTLAVLNNITMTPEIEAAIIATAEKAGIDPKILRSRTLLRLRLSALLHDVGKMEARDYGEIICESCRQPTKVKNVFNPICQNCGYKNNVNKINSPTFNFHEYMSEKTSRNILKRLKFDSQMINWVSRDCALHQVNFDNYLGKKTTQDIQGKPMRKTLTEKLYNDLVDRKPSSPDIWDDLNFVVRIYGIIRADSSAHPQAAIERVNRFISEYENDRKKREENEKWQDFNKPILSGDEIMSIFGIKPGKWIGDIHNRIREDKMNNPESHTRERAIQIAQEELDRYGPEIYKQ